MNLELFIAKRIHFNKEGDQQVTPPAVKLAIIGIALGLAVMILSVAIIVGFKKEVRNKVIGFGSHIRITNFDSNNSFENIPLVITDSLLEELREYPGIQHAERFATKPGILKTDSETEGIVLKGVDEDYDWTFFRTNLIAGDVITIDPEKNSTEVIISKYLADRIQLKLGDSFLAYFIQEDVRARKFSVIGIYETGFLDYDKLFVIADIKQVRRLNGWDKDEASGLEILVDNYRQLDTLTEELFYYMSEKTDDKGNSFFVESIKDLNPMIFNWLSVLDINVIVILILIMAVAGFTMISGLLIIILERVNMIGILKAMGENNLNIRKIFI
ncbi:MAG: ABC transporter permease, partial [Tannerellaceae bacterium]|nr:ABC transporter permease [Tannerellaceae bacterium]